jgi:hypothetical protein
LNNRVSKQVLTVDVPVRIKKLYILLADAVFGLDFIVRAVMQVEPPVRDKNG